MAQNMYDRRAVTSREQTNTSVQADKIPKYGGKKVKLNRSQSRLNGIKLHHQNQNGQQQVQRKTVRKTVKLSGLTQGRTRQRASNKPTSTENIKQKIQRLFAMNTLKLNGLTQSSSRHRTISMPKAAENKQTAKKLNVQRLTALNTLKLNGLTQGSSRQRASNMPTSTENRHTAFSKTSSLQDLSGNSINKKKHTPQKLNSLSPKGKEKGTLRAFNKQPTKVQQPSRFQRQQNSTQTAFNVGIKRSTNLRQQNGNMEHTSIHAQKPKRINNQTSTRRQQIDRQSLRNVHFLSRLRGTNSQKQASGTASLLSNVQSTTRTRYKPKHNSNGQRRNRINERRPSQADIQSSKGTEKQHATNSPPPSITNQKSSRFDMKQSNKVGQHSASMKQLSSPSNQPAPAREQFSKSNASPLKRSNNGHTSSSMTPSRAIGRNNLRNQRLHVRRWSDKSQGAPKNTPKPSLSNNGNLESRKKSKYIPNDNNSKRRQHRINSARRTTNGPPKKQYTASNGRQSQNGILKQNRNGNQIPSKSRNTNTHISTSVSGMSGLRNGRPSDTRQWHSGPSSTSTDGPGPGPKHNVQSNPNDLVIDSRPRQRPSYITESNPTDRNTPPRSAPAYQSNTRFSTNNAQSRTNQEVDNLNRQHTSQSSSGGARKSNQQVIKQDQIRPTVGWSDTNNRNAFVKTHTQPEATRRERRLSAQRKNQQALQTEKLVSSDGLARVLSNVNKVTRFYANQGSARPSIAAGNVFSVSSSSGSRKGQQRSRSGSSSQYNTRQPQVQSATRRHTYHSPPRDKTTGLFQNRQQSAWNQYNNGETTHNHAPDQSVNNAADAESSSSQNFNIQPPPPNRYAVHAPQGSLRSTESQRNSNPPDAADRATLPRVSQYRVQYTPPPNRRQYDDHLGAPVNQEQENNQRPPQRYTSQTNAYLPYIASYTRTPSQNYPSPARPHNPPRRSQYPPPARPHNPHRPSQYPPPARPHNPPRPSRYPPSARPHFPPPHSRNSPSDMSSDLTETNTPSRHINWPKRPTPYTRNSPSSMSSHHFQPARQASLTEGQHQQTTREHEHTGTQSEPHQQSNGHRPPSRDPYLAPSGNQYQQQGGGEGQPPRSPRREQQQYPPSSAEPYTPPRGEPYHHSGGEAHPPRRVKPYPPSGGEVHPPPRRGEPYSHSGAEAHPPRRVDTYPNAGGEAHTPPPPPRGEPYPYSGAEAHHPHRRVEPYPHPGGEAHPPRRVEPYPHSGGEAQPPPAAADPYPQHGAESHPPPSGEAGGEAYPPPSRVPYRPPSRQPYRPPGRPRHMPARQSTYTGGWGSPPPYNRPPAHTVPFMDADMLADIAEAKVDAMRSGGSPTHGRRPAPDHSGVYPGQHTHSRGAALNPEAIRLQHAAAHRRLGPIRGAAHRQLHQFLRRGGSLTPHSHAAPHDPDALADALEAGLI